MRKALIKNNWSLKRTKTDLLWARRTSASSFWTRNAALPWVSSPRSRPSWIWIYQDSAIPLPFFKINLSPLLSSPPVFSLYFSPVSAYPRPSTARSHEISGVARGGGESWDEKHLVPQLPPIPDSPGKDSVSCQANPNPHQYLALNPTPSLSLYIYIRPVAYVLLENSD